MKTKTRLLLAVLFVLALFVPSAWANNNCDQGGTCTSMNTATLSSPPTWMATQLLLSGTSLTFPTGSTFCKLTMCGGGGSGGGVDAVGGAQTACSAASGAAGACSVLGFNVAVTGVGPFTVQIGAKGTPGGANGANATGVNGTGAGSAAGTLVADPTGSTNIIVGGVTWKDAGGAGGGLQQTGTCASAPSAAAGGSALANASTNLSLLGVAVLVNISGGNGQAGSTTQSAASIIGGTNGNPGGQAGSANAGGTATSTATAGQAGYIQVECQGGTAF